MRMSKSRPENASQIDNAFPRLDFWCRLSAFFISFKSTGNQYKYLFPALILVTNTYHSFGKSNDCWYYYRNTNRRYFYQNQYQYLLPVPKFSGTGIGTDTEILTTSPPPSPPVPIPKYGFDQEL